MSRAMPVSEAAHDPGRAHLRTLTSLRFFAALVVAVCHFYELGLVKIPRGFYDATDGGGNAVTFFFVLSGFILTYNYSGMSTREQRLRYGVARIARIWPVTVLCLGIAVVGLLLAAALGRFGVWYSGSHATVALPAAFLGQLFMVNAWVPAAAVQVPFNPPSWSIACEMFFYLSLPVLLVWLREHADRAIRWVAALTLGVQGVVLFALARVRGSLAVDLVAYRFPVVHLGEFVVGVCAGLLFLRHPRWVTGAGRVLVVSGAAVALVVLMAWRPVWPHFYLLTPFFAVGIAAIAAGESGGRGVLRSRLLVLLGESSFALYLLHWPIAQIAQVLGLADPWGWLLLAATTGLSTVVFTWYETPLRRAIQRLGTRRLERSVTRP